jgi:hypothetical protein
MAIVTPGVDLAKNVFALHGVDATGKAVLVRPSVARAELLKVVAALPPCLMAWKPAPARITGPSVPGPRPYGAADGT